MFIFVHVVDTSPDSASSQIKPRYCFGYSSKSYQYALGSFDGRALNDFSMRRYSIWTVPYVVAQDH